MVGFFRQANYVRNVTKARTSLLASVAMGAALSIGVLATAGGPARAAGIVANWDVYLDAAFNYTGTNARYLQLLLGDDRWSGSGQRASLALLAKSSFR